MSWPSDRIKVTAVRYVGDWTLELKFNDETVGLINLEQVIRGKGGVFAPLEDERLFAQARVNANSGTLEWPNEVDLDPDVLYSEVTGLPIPFADPEPETQAKPVSL